MEVRWTKWSTMLAQMRRNNHNNNNNIDCIVTNEPWYDWLTNIVDGPNFIYIIDFIFIGPIYLAYNILKEKWLSQQHFGALALVDGVWLSTDNIDTC